MIALRLSKGQEADCLPRYVIENGMKDPAYLIQLLNNRRLYPSIDAIISLPYDRKYQLSALSYTLKESCPRWWDALGLDSDPYTAWRNCLKKHGGLPEVDKTPADTVEVIMRLRKLDDIEPTLPSSVSRSDDWRLTFIADYNPGGVGYLRQSQSLPNRFRTVEALGDGVNQGSSTTNGTQSCLRSLIYFRLQIVYFSSWVTRWSRLL